MLTETENSIKKLNIIYEIIKFMFIMLDIILIIGIFGFINIHKPMNESFYIIDLNNFVIYLLCFIVIFINQIIILVLIKSQKNILENTWLINKKLENLK